MDYSTLSNDAILAEIGARLRRLRLNADIGQEQLAETTGLSRKTIQNAENGGNSSLDTVVRILRALNELQQLDNFLPAPGPSPVQLARMQGKLRQRASGQREAAVHENKGRWQW